MGRFLEQEKPRQASFKADSPYFSEIARADGVYKSKLRPFCVPLDHAEENLFPEIRQTALAFFASQRIKWHDGQNGKPNNHLCDSQVCCVNFLFPFADKPSALAELLRPVYPDLRRMLPIESGQYVTFEWIGQENYLGEKISRNGIRTRGANCTSADAAVLFERTDGGRQIVPIEWKYTESYYGTPLKIAKSGTDRTAIYRPLYMRDDCPINKTLLPAFDALFYEPFYQFMRQQLLAHEMERARELCADIASVLHIAPEHNTDFDRITSPALKKLDTKTAVCAWKKLAPPDRFMIVSTEKLFGNPALDQLPELTSWLKYVHCRYRWVQGE
ncbi:MAG: hypothetical protein GX552_17665 [Chloroflexi bacterium]|nr:hypothetical protein [Chloroflexota bacterium]